MTEDRAISLNAAIKRFQLWYSDLLLNHEEEYSFENLLRELPPVTPKQQWIPVSEKPSKNGGYLCSARFNDNYIGVCIANYADDLYKVDDFDFHDKKGISGWYDYDSEYGYYEMESVIAWMPLPEPYKGEQPKIIKCPNCGNVQFADKEWCPDCGAKMVEPQERE